MCGQFILQKLPTVLAESMRCHLGWLCGKLLPGIFVRLALASEG
jgi:hypothetical protein